MVEESPRRDSVADLGEEALVSRLVSLIPSRPDLVAGPGDDCAVVDEGNGVWRLLKTDSLVEGVHFLPGTDPIPVGRKAMNRALSDIAAMGGFPRHALVSLAVDSSRRCAEIEGWYQGLLGAASDFGCAVVGGETTRLPCRGAVITVAVSGIVAPEACTLRSGASVGDLIAVTGRLGGSFASGRHLSFIPRLREARWFAENAKPSAMMDLSDGLGSDLPRLAAASGIGYRVDLEKLPCHSGVSPDQAVSEGEDYELLLTFAPEIFQGLLPKWEKAFPGLLLTAIGEMVETTVEPLPRGWEHYREP